MVNKTALSRERAKRCEWCAKLYPRDPRRTNFHRNIGAGNVKWLMCDAPALVNLYEVLAKERDELQAALEMLYDKWEDGTPCFEDPKDCAGSLGKAFNLSCEEEAHILALIPRAAREKETQNG